MTEQDLDELFRLTISLCPSCSCRLVLTRYADEWDFGCIDGCAGFVVTAETLAGVIEQWREAVG